MFKRLRQDWLQDCGLLTIRMIVGVIFVFHGGQKLFGLWHGSGLDGFAAYLQTLDVPLPAVAAVLAGAAEFLGGLALISGAWMRLAIVPLLITMGVAVATVHRQAFAIQDNGMEYALTLALVLVGLALTGPGRLSISGRLPRSRRMVIGAGGIEV
jgi:putative oxidoreductase